MNTKLMLTFIFTVGSYVNFAILSNGHKNKNKRSEVVVGLVCHKNKHN